MAPRDFVLFLIVAETAYQGLLGADYSIATALLVITTVAALDSLLRKRFRTTDRYQPGPPMVIVDDGRPLKDRMNQARIDERRVLEVAWRQYGLTSVDEIACAVVERSGEIAIVPRGAKARKYCRQLPRRSSRAACALCRLRVCRGRRRRLAEAAGDVGSGLSAASSSWRCSSGSAKRS